MILRQLLLFGLVICCTAYTPPSGRIAKVNAFDNRADCDQDNLPVTATDTTQRLLDLRSLMIESSYAAYIIPSNDAHLSEYISPKDKKRKWITGFTGSAGTAVVTLDKAALWTDGRYFEQAPTELDCNWILMKSEQPGVPTIEEWLSTELSGGEKVAANPFLFSIGEWQSYADNLQPIQMAEAIPDLIDEIWLDPPEALDAEIYIYPIEYSGVSHEDKLDKVRQQMAEESCEYLLITRLDDSAWFFNLRGGDIPHTPVFTAYALISASANSKIFLNTSQLQDDVQPFFNQPGCESSNNCVEFLPYEDAQTHLELAEQDVINKSGKLIWMPVESTSYGMYSTVDPSLQLSINSIIPVEKAAKNPTEIEGMKTAHIVDGVALCEYLKWLEENVPLGTVDEISGAAKLEEYRLSQPLNKDLSFGSISASGPNGAIIHYGATPETNRRLTIDEMYMIDSGGQYYEGTTDVTRTLHFGKPTDFEKEMFTRALMGCIDGQSTLFPQGTVGNDIDIIVRRHLYAAGYNFNHGTGHGIGQYLCIHEFPPAIGRSGNEYQYGEYVLQPGMFVSIEPGYYEAGSFGLRHENIVHVVETGKDFEGRPFYQLEPVTLAPYQVSLLNLDLMSQDQIAYLNSYHQKVLDIVGNEAKNQNKMELYDWIVAATKPIEKKSSRSSSISLFQHFSSFTFVVVIISSVANQI